MTENTNPATPDAVLREHVARALSTAALQHGIGRLREPSRGQMADAVMNVINIEWRGLQIDNDRLQAELRIYKEALHDTLKANSALRGVVYKKLGLPPSFSVADLTQALEGHDAEIPRLTTDRADMVRAVQLTEDADWDAIAAWCGGVVRGIPDPRERRVYLIPSGLSAGVGDWIVRNTVGGVHIVCGNTWPFGQQAPATEDGQQAYSRTFDRLVTIENEEQGR